MTLQRSGTFLDSIIASCFAAEVGTSAADIQVAAELTCRTYVHEMLQSPPDGVMLVARLLPSGIICLLFGLQNLVQES